MTGFLAMFALFDRKGSEKSAIGTLLGDKGEIAVINSSQTDPSIRSGVADVGVSSFQCGGVGSGRRHPVNPSDESNQDGGDAGGKSFRLTTKIYPDKPLGEVKCWYENSRSEGG